MEFRSRPYQTEDDFWRMREFLRQVFLLNNRLMRSWHVARLDYARWHTCLNCAKVPLEEVVYSLGNGWAARRVPDARRRARRGALAGPSHPAHA